VVASGQTAIEAAQNSKPDLVLMDIHLKGKMDGIEAAQQIRNLVQIPVIYVTAYSDPEVLKRAKVTVPYGYIVKPFQTKELQAMIEIALYRHRIEHKLFGLEKLAAYGSLLNGVVHVIKEPLQSMVYTMKTQLLNTGLPPEQKDSLFQIYHSANKIKDFIQDLLYFEESTELYKKDLENEHLSEEVLFQGHALVMDQDMHVSLLSEVYLNHLGLRTQVEKEINQFWQALTEFNWDVVVLDTELLGLPEQKRLQEDFAAVLPKLILVNGDSSDPAGRSWASIYLQKPFTFNELRNAVGKVLR
jgi:DNA-binding response OmpR family regulator